MKYKVVDETGMALRLFYTLKEAEAFLQDGWTIVKLPRIKKKIDLTQFEDALI